MVSENMEQEQISENHSHRNRSRGVRGLIDSGLCTVRGWSVWKRWVIGVPTAVVVVVLGVVVADVALASGRVHPGVSVAGISVGRMSTQEAQETLEQVLLDRASESITLTFEDHEWIVASDDIGYAPDSVEMASAAMAVGRTGGISDWVSERFDAWTEGIDLPVIAASDKGLTDGFLTRIAREIDIEAQDASIEITGARARLIPAVVGVSLRPQAVEADMIAAFGSMDIREVGVQIDFTPVAVTDEDAEQALLDAQTLMSDDITIVFEDTVWEFSAEEVASWIAFRTEPVSEPYGTTGSSGVAASDTATGTEYATADSTDARLQLVAFISADEASDTISPRVGTAGKDPVDAHFAVDGDQVRVVPAEDGTGPDLEALAREMTRRLLSDGERDVELRTMRRAPEITTEMAQEMGIETRIGTYSTTYSASNRPRVNNIHTLADALDGTLVAPGEVFSFNDTIGPRTADKGYQAAPAIVDGELVPQLGGGICQVATTIFNAVFESGLPVVERSPHSLYISHYPTGRDAAVSWGNPDFQFKNDTDDWVLIRAFYTNSSIRLSLFGPELGYDVTSAVGSWSVARAYTVREVEDPTLPVGSMVVEDPGVDGKRISVTRIVMKSGNEIRRDVFTSVYRSQEEVVRVGTMPVSEPETQTPASAF